MKMGKRLLAVFLSIGLLIVEPGAAVSSAYTSAAKKQSSEPQQAKCSFDESTGCLKFCGPGVITGNIEDASNEAGMKYLDIGAWGSDIDVSKVRSIVIEDGVTEIGQGVFTYLSGLKSVTIGDSVTKIGAGAFGCCRSLEEITIGNGVTDIGASAFADCDAIKNITIGKCVKNLGERFLGVAPRLEKINLAKGNEHFKIKGNILYSADGTELYLSPKKGIDKVTIAKGTKVIRQLAFSNASIDKVTIPASVQVLEAGAFYFCEKLKTVTFAKGSKCLRTEEYYQYFGDEVEEQYTVFGWCRKLKSISFGDKLETLSENTFNDCIKLECIHLGKNFKGFTKTDKKGVVTAMNQQSLSALQKITISKLNPKFCSEDGVLYSKSKKKLCMYPNGRKALSYTIKNSVQVIGDSAFRGNKSLQKIVFGAKVKEVEFGAFCNCSKLALVDMKTKLTRIGEAAFEMCVSLSDIRWSEKVRYIGNDAFWGDIKLKSIVFSNRSDIVVGQGAFEDCRKVTDVVWPKGFRKIGVSAFANCKNITRAMLAGKDLIISSYAFSGCRNLKAVVIKPGVTKLGREAFFDCIALKSVFVPKSVKTIGDKALGYKWSSAAFDEVIMKSFKIKGKKGSQAESYAKVNKFTFVIK